jgi:uncharacterized protein YndB with AHSA1/START domain
MTVTRELDLEIGADELWNLVGDGTRWADWLVDAGDVEVVDGGLGTVVDDEGTDRQVVVERVEPGRAVRFSWWPTGGPEQASTVELVVLPTHQGSRLLVTEVMASAHTPRTGLAWEMRIVCLWASTVCLASV